MSHTIIPDAASITDELRLHVAPDETMPRSSGEFVLYWLQTTHRTDDNFALAFAVEQANLLKVPVLVYHELPDDESWASARRHTFVLQGVIDLYRDFERLGIQYAFMLGSGALTDLAARAALVVTDFFPTVEARARTSAFRQHTETPLVAVDSCTVVPLRYHRHEYQSARSIRPVLHRGLPHFLFHSPAIEPRVRRPVELPFDPVRPTDATIPALVASRPIDHSVRPARHIRGGTRAARARLDRFLTHGLSRYLEARGDPNDEDGTSRLSPYLHFGQISMHEVLLAAEARELPEQYDRFRDEALVWRELAHNFTFFNARYNTPEGIPGWAREELRRGEHDPRPALYSADDLEASRTDDELWNAAQRAYVVDGWMHNAVRMLWGKAVVQWTPDMSECLRALIHLNNKYALDGCDPNSYTGILWTFGRFDRPFYRRPIYGTVRYQSLKSARKRFDVRAYVQRYSDAEPSLSDTEGDDSAVSSSERTSR